MNKVLHVMRAVVIFIMCSTSLLLSYSSLSFAAEPLVIESQVKGSQEQPKVIYIMPWQGVDEVIEVKGKKRTISLPTFEPINPRTFKAQVEFFSNKKITSAEDGKATEE